MKLILWLVLIWYFYSNYKLQALRVGGEDSLSVVASQNGYQEEPFFAGRGRRSGPLSPFQGSFLQTPVDNDENPASSNDRRRFLSPESEAVMRLAWPLQLPLELGQSSLYPARIKSQRTPSLNEPSVYYILYNLKKKQSNPKSGPEESPFMAARG